MSGFRRALIAPALAFALAGFAVGAVSAESLDMEGGPKALSSADRLSYTTAFDALRRGDLELARASARQANDRVLVGQVEFERLVHAEHTATYEELAAWLESEGITITAVTDSPHLSDRIGRLNLDELWSRLAEVRTP